MPVPVASSIAPPRPMPSAAASSSAWKNWRSSASWSVAEPGVAELEPDPESEADLALDDGTGGEEAREEDSPKRSAWTRAYSSAGCGKAEALSWLIFGSITPSARARSTATCTA